MQGPPGHWPAILLVEDDPAEVWLLREAFTAIPVRTQLQVVRDGRAALAFLRHEAPYQYAPRPALILLSLKLPGMSGHELLAELKRDPALEPIPALVFTNSESLQDIRQSYELGANGYLLKPFEFTQLVEMMHVLTVYWLQVVTLAPPPPLAAPNISKIFLAGQRSVSYLLLRYLLVEDNEGSSHGAQTPSCKKTLLR